MVFATHIISHCTYCIYLHVVCIIVVCFIYSRTLAPVAIVICWLYPTQNKFDLILSYLTEPHYWEVKIGSGNALIRQQAITRANVDPVLCHHKASLVQKSQNYQIPGLINCIHWYFIMGFGHVTRITKIIKKRQFYKCSDPDEGFIGILKHGISFALIFQWHTLCVNYEFKAPITISVNIFSQDW